MADAQDVDAEIERMASLDDDAFMHAVVDYITGGSGRRIPRDVQAAALASPTLATQTLDALESAIRQAKSFHPRLDGESKREQQARIAPFRTSLQAAMPPFQDAVDDLAHKEAKYLAALDDQAFERRWTAHILEDPTGAPIPPRVRALGFRSPRVAARAEAICRLMMEEPTRFLPASALGKSQKADDARIAEFRQRVESEARYLRYAVQYADARHGRMPSEPNVRLQALRLLGEAHPEELSKLLHQVRDGRRAGRAEARKDERAVRRTSQRRAP
ncbi:hypothetical protein [Streptomyces sp. NBC_00620]|uniref:hypothetical protein n=1 Tax=Streptomyces sp. NBC_00620 TaxID=2903666 RepID=UPI00224F2C48|nr:hypothetical protein [Streptomyces sp. NBC_00620]MCX4976426.1 hypothetical protein [Streptomyces sp. NBC_00620]